MPDEPVDIGALEIGKRFRVDWRHGRLRRTFRAVGILVSIEDGTDDEPGQVLTFEVRPRFGKPAPQHVNVTTVTALTRLPDRD